MAYIKFDKVSVYYQDKNKSEIIALNDLEVEFEKNTINVIIGESGCGKTTLLNCLAGSLLYNGQISINDVDISKIKIQDRNISYVNQEATLYPGLTVYENIAFPLMNKREKYEEYDLKVKDIASKLGITLLLTRKPKFISIGQASRVCIARSFVKNSDIYLFDEPLAHLDNDNKNKIIKIIKDEAKAQKSTVLYVTHDINEAYRLADFVYVIDNGRLVAKCKPNELLKNDNKIIKKLMVEFSDEKV